MKNLKVGDEIIVRHSTKLAQSGLAQFANKTGVVTRLNVVNGIVTGVWADVAMSHRTRNCYIPESSIEIPGRMNRWRTLNILKSINI